MISDNSEIAASHAPVKASYADVVKGGKPRNSLNTPKSKRETLAASEQPLESTSKKKHRYWSTSQDQKEPITTLDGFRRHEVEREVFYVFLPNGVYESTLSGPACVLCLARDPDDDHWEKEHGQSKNVESATTSIKKSRKGDFAKLLKNRKVPRPRIKLLVEQWRHISPKKGWSCGLCICRFETLAERTNHLAHKHYEKGQDRQMWKTDNLIKGLLSEPYINREYRRQFGLDPSDQLSGLTWDPAFVPMLQERLEMCVEDPGILAGAAHDFATVDEPTPGDYNPQTTASRPTTARFDHLSLMSPSIADDSITTLTTDYAPKSQFFPVDVADDGRNLGPQVDSSQPGWRRTLGTAYDADNDFSSLQDETSFFDSAICGAGGAFPRPETPRHEDMPSSNISSDKVFDEEQTVVEEHMEDEEQAFDVMQRSQASRTISAPIPTPYGPSSSQEAGPWTMVRDAPHSIRNLPPYLRQPKRQLSQSSKDAAHIKPQKNSPMPSQLRQMTQR